MTRKEVREERSKQRAREHRSLVRFYTAGLVVWIMLLVGVPLVWYSALEYGLVQPIRSPELKKYLGIAQGLLMMGIGLFGSQVFLILERGKRRPRPIAGLKSTKS